MIPNPVVNDVPSEMNIGWIDCKPLSQAGEISTPIVKEAPTELIAGHPGSEIVLDAAVKLQPAKFPIDKAWSSCMELAVPQHSALGRPA